MNGQSDWDKYQQIYNNKLRAYDAQRVAPQHHQVVQRQTDTPRQGSQDADLISQYQKHTDKIKTLQKWFRGFLQGHRPIHMNTQPKKHEGRKFSGPNYAYGMGEFLTGCESVQRSGNVQAIQNLINAVSTGDWQHSLFDRKKILPSALERIAISAASRPDNQGINLRQFATIVLYNYLRYSTSSIELGRLIDENKQWTPAGQLLANSLPHEVNPDDFKYEIAQEYNYKLCPEDIETIINQLLQNQFPPQYLPTGDVNTFIYHKLSGQISSGVDVIPLLDCQNKWTHLGQQFANTLSKGVDLETLKNIIYQLPTFEQIVFQIRDVQGVELEELVDICVWRAPQDDEYYIPSYGVLDAISVACFGADECTHLIFRAGHTTTRDVRDYKVNNSTPGFVFLMNEVRQSPLTSFCVHDAPMRLENRAWGMLHDVYHQKILSACLLKIRSALWEVLELLNKRTGFEISASIWKRYDFINEALFRNRMTQEKHSYLPAEILAIVLIDDLENQPMQSYFTPQQLFYALFIFEIACKKKYFYEKYDINLERLISKITRMQGNNFKKVIGFILSCSEKNLLSWLYAIADTDFNNSNELALITSKQKDIERQLMDNNLTIAFRKLSRKSSGYTSIEEEYFYSNYKNEIWIEATKLYTHST